ncbi:AAA family ATPase [Roseiarcaceae bacterium H3SJ34-1]|uniref:bifunctional aminoglycoside phosphotransferase/ATP-binding protein n=1 Tax=Terripilifer ovatus TaxID=3032367 RepID=UPI003AB95757|nr:AAA family ATPase [Roseiarcaceae bacterium H3SJ34-1]
MPERTQASASIQADTQQRVFAFMKDPRTYGTAGDVRRIDTHGAAVFLAGDDVYKIKRAVKFPFMDFSTLEKRRRVCEAEIAINRPNAPDIYLGVVPITLKGETLAIDGGGEVVEWAVHMRRFDENATLDRMADAGPISPDLARSLGDIIHRSHDGARRGDGDEAVAALRDYIDQNDEAFAALPDLFDTATAGNIYVRSLEHFARCESLMRQRGEDGYVRRCHGDLHLANIAMRDGAPFLFDAIEFDDAIATCDILYDLAFVLMDLDVRDQREAGNVLFNRYLQLCDDDRQLAGLAALPFFLSLRAAIRAKVIAAKLAQAKNSNAKTGDLAAIIADARRYFRYAADAIEPEAPRLVAVGGLSGTGKSRLAMTLAPGFGRAPGAVLLRSDIERKLLHGVADTERLPETAYGTDTTTKVYDQLHRKAALALGAGQSVIMDAVHARPHERQAAETTAAECGCPFIGLWLETPLDVRVARIEGRKNDASDATAAVAKGQAAFDTGPITWARVDASGDLDKTASEAKSIID